MIVKDIEVKNIMTKTNLPVSDFAVNPYVGCTHACCMQLLLPRRDNEVGEEGEMTCNTNAE